MAATKMLDRRALLKTGLGVGLGGKLFGTTKAHNKNLHHAPEQCTPRPLGAGPLSAAPPASPLGANLFDQKWARANLEELGIPRSWWHVHQGLFPFSPERALVISRRPSARGFGDLKDRLLERGLGRDEYFSEEKLDYGIWIMQTLAKYYGVPEYLEDWATRLAARESLGVAMGLCCHWGVVHQFQQRGDQQPVLTQNGLVDWWLFLIPGGVDFQSLDGRPTHVLFGCVDTDGSLGQELSCFSLITQLARSLDNGVALSRMDRLAVARHLNERLLELL